MLFKIQIDIINKRKNMMKKKRKPKKLWTKQ
jgi:hypothetical protein